MSSENKELSINPEPSSSHESEVVDYIETIEVPFMQALFNEYGISLGWRICGPASIALSRILAAKFSIPISRRDKGEHMELAIGIYDPHNQRDRLNRIEEHTYIRYYNGQNSVYYIDPIYGLLMGKHDGFKDSIQVEKYPVNEIDAILLANNNLYPFNPNHPDLTASLTFSSMTTSELRLKYYNDAVTALNDDRATLPFFITNSGNLMRTNDDGVRKVIKQFVPEWRSFFTIESELKMMYRKGLIPPPIRR